MPSWSLELIVLMIKGRNKSVADAIIGDCDDMSDEWFEYVLENSGAEY